MKIVLCNPEVSLRYSHSRKGMYPPLGILAIATFLERKLKNDIEIEVIDGDVEEIRDERFKGADLVGFHVNSFNYGNCIELAQKAKEYGAKVVFGGPHASVLWRNIMMNRSFVDFIVIEEGEMTMTLLIKKLENNLIDEFEEIPNLVYRNKNGVPKKANKNYVNTKNDLITPSREFVDIEKYIDNYRKIYTKDQVSFDRPASIYSSKGCTWRDKSGGCIFCARLDKGVRFRNIKQIWEEIRDLSKLYEIDYIWDISDDNLNSPEWFKSFVNQKPDELNNISFLIYSRVNRISDDIISYLRKLNVYEVYLGFESGDNQILKQSFKGANIDIAIGAAERLKRAGIFYFPSFVLGLPGETEKSLSNTLKFAERLAKIGSIYRMSATILMPIPGSKVFQSLLENKEFGEVLSKKDLISIKELEKLWIDHYTNIDYATAKKYQKLISEVIIDKFPAEIFGLNIENEC